MAEQPAHEVVIELERTGERIASLSQYELRAGYMTPADDWTVTVYDPRDPRGLRRKFAPLQPVRLYLDGALQLVGRIDRIEGVGRSGAALQVSGRDYLATLVDGNADPAVRFTAGTDIEDAVLAIARPFGITQVAGDFSRTRNLLTGKSQGERSAPSGFQGAKLTDFKIGSGQGAFEAANRIAARHGFTIQSAHERHAIALAAPSYDQAPAYRLERRLDGRSNLEQASARRDYTSVPTVIKMTGRAADVSGGKKIPAMQYGFACFGADAPNRAAQVEEVKRIAYGPGGAAPEVLTAYLKPTATGIEDNGGLLYRPLFLEDPDARTVAQITHAANRALSERMKDTLIYSATVRGHTDADSGSIYAVDTIAHVYDEIEDVDEPMWVLDRTISNDGSGPQTQLTLIRPGAITL